MQFSVSTTDYFGLDKVYHFFAGLLIFLVVSTVSSPLVGLAVVGIIGMGKEVYDSQHPDKHTTSVWDFLWTVFGGLIGASVWNFI
jgi:hypothetical protein